MSARLEEPSSCDELYLARMGEVQPFRPILQGDIFREVTIPGVALAHELVMVISHPCSMRAGPALREAIKAVPVTEYEEVPLSRWPDSHYRVFPLPDLVGSIGHHAARFDWIGMVASSELRHERRIACLSERGMLLLQQRFTFSDTRAVIGLDTLETATASVLEEVELLEEWNEQLVPLHASDVETALADEASAFDQFLQTEVEPGLTLRAMLREQHRRAAVRRSVREEIARRALAAG